MTNAFHSLAQTATALAIYNVMQQKCVSCHSGTTPSGNLKLDGSASAVYTALYMKTPTNATAAAAGDKLIYPGRLDKSYFFRKINMGFEPYAPSLRPNEGNAMPNNGGTGFTNEEKELVRQWILFGAPSAGEVVPPARIADYYQNGGLQAFPNGAPPAPAPGEGFQIKMGPFLLAPNGQPGSEAEYFQKWETFLPANTEVDRINNFMSGYSHHYIMYKYGANPTSLTHGLRPNANHSDVTLVEAVQEATDLRLPATTAFFWNSNVVLDLNTHYINYSNTKTYLAEVYANVYTKPSGSAQQQMYSSLIPKTDIYIPNDQNPHSFSQSYTFGGLPNIYLWSLMGHTHKYGTDYKIYRRQANGTQGEMLYDAQCPNGIPGCGAPYFDYQHIPLRTYEPLNPLNMTTGFIHTASYLNDGPAPVGFGATSNDEMMVMILMYTLAPLAVGTEQAVTQKGFVKVYPNPAATEFTLELDDSEDQTLRLETMTGQLVKQIKVSQKQLKVQRDGLPQGMYLLRLIDKSGNQRVGKIVLD